MNRLALEKTSEEINLKTKLNALKQLKESSIKNQARNIIMKNTEVEKS